MEEAGRGKFVKPNQTEFERQWTSALAEIEQEMSASWLERHLVPLDESDRLFYVRRYQAERAALGIAHARAGQGSHESGDGSGPLLGSELWVETNDKAVGGLIDSAYLDGSDVVLQDYKTGVVLETGQGGEEDVKEAYQVQLRMYAALYHEKTGVWPARLEVVSPAGGVFGISFSQDECVALIGEARDALMAVAQTLSVATSADAAQDALAAPSPAVCAWCPHRPCCLPYLRTAPGDCMSEWPSDAWGTVLNVEESGDQLAITVDSRIGAIVRIREVDEGGDRHPAVVELPDGAVLAAFNLVRQGDGESLKTGKLTAFYQVDPELLPG